MVAPVLIGGLCQWTLSFMIPSNELATMYMQGNLLICSFRSRSTGPPVH